MGIAGPTGSLEKLKSKDWERTIQVDVNSHFYFTKKLSRYLKNLKMGQLLIFHPLLEYLVFHFDHLMRQVNGQLLVLQKH